MNEQQALDVLASMDAWLCNRHGLLIEDVIEWRNALAVSLGKPEDSWFEDERIALVKRKAAQ